ncbi:unnamed protein product [Effrenium voratum]|nr:unnamed protein product [Effrenium voratum]
MLCRSAASALPATAHWPCGAPRAPRARTPPPRSCRQWPAALAVLVCRHYRPGRCRVPRAEAAQGKAASAGRNSRDARNAKDLPSEDAEVWQPRGALEPVADLAEMLLPDLIISNMEKITRHTSSSSGFPAFIEHSKIVTAWDVQRQRAFGGKLLRQTIPEPLTQLCSGILKTLQLWPEFYGHAIRFGAATIGAVTSHWLVGETRVLSEEEATVPMALVDEQGAAVVVGETLGRWLEAGDFFFGGEDHEARQIGEVSREDEILELGPHTFPRDWPDVYEESAALRGLLGRRGICAAKRVSVVPKPQPLDGLEAPGNAVEKVRYLQSYANACNAAIARGLEAKATLARGSERSVVEGWAIYDLLDDVTGAAFLAERYWWNAGPDGTWYDYSPFPENMEFMLLAEAFCPTGRSIGTSEEIPRVEPGTKRNKRINQAGVY